MTELIVTLRALLILMCHGALIVADARDLPASDAIDTRIRQGDLSIIEELKDANTPDAVFELARIVHLLGSYDAPKKYPGVWQAAAKALAEMPGACELLADRLSADVRAHRVGRNRPDMDVLEMVRNEEAVRVVGELLFDEYEHWFDPVPTDTEPAIQANKDFAKGVFAVWLYDYPEFRERLGYDTSAWQQWWNERKHDPETIQSIADGRRPPDVVPPPPVESPPAGSDHERPHEPSVPPVAVPQGDPRQPPAPPTARSVPSRVLLLAVSAAVAFVASLLWLRRRGSR